jgi:hypothetical protein
MIFVKMYISAQMSVNINKFELNSVETTFFMNELFEMHIMAAFHVMS